MNKKIGYYTSNGQEFASKVHCMLYAKKENLPINWHFNQQEFGAYDFSQEPSTDLDMLYNLRAKQLREQYDYLILSYSGGADSHNILMSFYRQGLHVDEIISNWFNDATKDGFSIPDKNLQQSWNQNAEYELNTREKLDWITNYMPKTKITVWDCTKNLLSYYIKAKDESWVLDAKDTLNPGGHQRYNYFHIKEVRNRIDATTSVGVIIGVDKAPCTVDNGKLYLQFVDKTANNVPMDPNFNDYSNTTMEFFYWSPESKEILSKQSHLLLKFLNTNKQYRHLWDSASNLWMFRDARERLMRTLFYTTWDNTWFQVDKPTKDWDSEFDYWFSQSSAFGLARQNWNTGLKYLQTELGDNFLSPDKRGLVSFTSPAYYIGNLTD